MKEGDIVRLTLATGDPARGRILYLDAPEPGKRQAADVEILDPPPVRPVVWAYLDELAPEGGLGHKCNYTPTRQCDCVRECALHFTDSEGC